MNTQNLTVLKRNLRRAYKEYDDVKISQYLNDILEMLSQGREGYPIKVLEGLDRNVKIFQSLLERVDSGCTNYVIDYDEFVKASEDLAYNVFLPWLCELGLYKGDT